VSTIRRRASSSRSLGQPTRMAAASCCRFVTTRSSSLATRPRTTRLPPAIASTCRRAATTIPSTRSLVRRAVGRNFLAPHLPDVRSVYPALLLLLLLLLLLPSRRYCRFCRHRRRSELSEPARSASKGTKYSCLRCGLAWFCPPIHSEAGSFATGQYTSKHAPQPSSLETSIRPP